MHIMLVLVVGALVGSNSVQAVPQKVCQELALAVSLTPGGPANQTVRGTLCRPESAPPGSTPIDILTPGATYNRSYWDFPLGGGYYSYVDRTVRAGRATFAYDRLGTGASSHPLSVQLSILNEAEVLHQIVTWARPRFTEVNTIGHSMGSVISIQEAADHDDVDRLVVTGELHALGPASPLLAASTYPATLDPRFFLKPLDVGYFTTLPGLRGALFYLAGGASAEVIAWDEATKDVVPATGLVGIALQMEAPPLLNVAQRVRAPVFAIAGAQDTQLCGLTLDCTSPAAVQANEELYYSSAASVTAETVPFTGHDLALHYSAPESFARIDQWIRETP